MEDAQISRLFTRVYLFIGRRMRTEHEVREFIGKYKGQNVSEEKIEDIVRTLKQDHYLDDHTFARVWIESRMKNKPKSPRLLRIELKKKGIDDNSIETVLSEFSFSRDAQLDLVVKAVGKRARQWQNLPFMTRKKKLMTFIQYRGFSFDLLDDLVEKLWGNEYNTG